MLLPNGKQVVPILIRAQTAGSGHHVLEPQIGENGHDRGIRRGGLHAGAQQHIPQGAGRKIRALGKEKDIIQPGPGDASATAFPNARRGAEQGDFRRIVRRRDQPAGAAWNVDVQIGNQQARFVRRVKRHVFIAKTVRMLADIDGAGPGVMRFFHRITQLVKPGRDRGEGRDGLELRHDQGKSP